LEPNIGKTQINVDKQTLYEGNGGNMLCVDKYWAKVLQLKHTIGQQNMQTCFLLLSLLYQSLWPSKRWERILSE